MEISLKMVSVTSIGKRVPMHNKMSRYSINNPSSDHHVVSFVSCKMKEVGMQNLYQVLSLDHSSTEDIGFDKIKRAYRTQALRLHPDVCPPSVFSREECTKRFLEVRKAYEVLSDPVSRKMYDDKLLSVCGHDYSLGFEEDGRCRVGGRTEKFRRDVWETQLDGLRKRSMDRMETRKIN